MSKTNRVVVITGGGTGMGRSAAHRFADNGDTVCILGRRAEKLQETADGRKNIECFVADITKLDELKKARENVISRHKRIDVLVNCAGGNIKVDANASLNEQHESFVQIININLTGTYNVIAVFDADIIDDGRIINISSLAAQNGSRQGGVSGQAYAAAKAGIHGLSRTLVGKFAPRRITVNCISPGFIPGTDFFGNAGPSKEILDFYVARSPLGRVGQAEDIANGIFYLASPEANFITGEILNINGGVIFGR